MRTVSGQTAIVRQNFYNRLAHFLHYYEASNLACGLILTRCRQIGELQWRQLSGLIAKEDPQAAAQYFFDESTGLFAVILDDKRLSFTHFLSLILKEHLQTQQLLMGEIIVASFPESCASVEELAIGMMQATEREAGGEGEIRIYNRSVRESDRPALLVVDEDETILEFLRIRLGMKGFDVHTAADGREGINLFERVSPDLVITELTLPVVDGYQLISEIRESRENNCRIMVLTGRRLETDICQCFEQGVADYLTKPFSPVELEVRIQRLFMQS